MQFLLVVVVALAIATLGAAFTPNWLGVYDLQPKWGGSSVAKSAPTPAPAPTSSSPFEKAEGFLKKYKGKDMTWGGRPDPAPEMIVEDKPGFFSLKGRFGK